jgi:nicotinamide-nucleotide amidase
MSPAWPCFSTLETVANAFGRKMVFSKAAEKNVLSRLKRLRRFKPGPGHKKQMLIPEGAKVLDNLEGSAPGIRLQIGETCLFFLPGVPREYDFILNKHLFPFFEKYAALEREHLFIYKIFGWPESAINDFVHSLRIPDSVAVGFRTTLPENHLKLMVRASDRSSAEKKIDRLVKKIKSHFGSSLFSEGDMTFEEAILKQLLQQKAIVSIAESCTGGLVSSMITKVSGSSAVLDRSFITYSNQAKMDLLGVSVESLKKHGAVSEQVVCEMAQGSLKRSRATKSVAISGIAGPTGGTKLKPVGTIWIAASSSRKTLTKKLTLPFARELNQKYAAYEALKLLTSI